MSKIRFGDGIPKIKRRKSTDIYPEELLDKVRKRPMILMTR